MWPFSTYPIHSPEDVASREYDYIVVGGGTAGCVVASRLTESANTSVLLIERGPVVTAWESGVPLISSNFTSQKAPTYKWNSMRMPGINDRELSMAGGKALGGSSKINGLIYHRSVPAEYDAWKLSGRKGWGWEDVEPFFKKSENCLSHRNSSFRGTQGPWKNQCVKQDGFEIVARNIEAAQSLGIPYVPIANDPESPASSCTRIDATVDDEGRRSSTFEAFLPQRLAAERRRRLFICPATIVVSLDIQLIEGSHKVTGVHFEPEAASHRNSRFHASARLEVVLCCGAIGTPQLLLLSGIGPTNQVKSLGIELIRSLPGVGAHLQDHISVPVMYKAPVTDTVEVLLAKPLVAAWQLLKYLFTGKGIFGAQVQQANVILHSDALDNESRLTSSVSDSKSVIPDVEVMFLPVNPTTQSFDGLAETYGAFCHLCTILRPYSFGSLQLSSIDPREPPRCDLGTFNDARDYLPMRKALRLARTLNDKVRGLGYPLEDLLVPSNHDDATMDVYARNHVMSTFHYSSSCRMAPENDQGVVDDDLRVYGILGLRIADASIFPEIPACHIQAPVVMVAERCAQFLIDEERASSDT